MVKFNINMLIDGVVKDMEVKWDEINNIISKYIG